VSAKALEVQANPIDAVSVASTFWTFFAATCDDSAAYRRLEHLKSWRVPYDTTLKETLLARTAAYRYRPATWDLAASMTA
jgi:hypothetical protein